MQFALGFFVGAFLTLLAVFLVPNVFWRTKTKLKQLDPLHWCLLASLVILAGAGWWAACQASDARSEVESLKLQYLKPQPPQGLK